MNHLVGRSYRKFGSVTVLPLLAAVQLASVSPTQAMPAPKDAAALAQSLPPGVTLKVVFTTGEGGHAGSDDINVDIGTVSVVNGAMIDLGHSLQVWARNLPPSPAECFRTVSLGGTGVSGDGSCSPDSSTMILEGQGTEGVRAVDSHNVPQNVGIKGTVRIVIADKDTSDNVQVFFAPEPTDVDHLWAAARLGQSPSVSSLVFSVPITRGGISSSCAGALDVPHAAQTAPHLQFRSNPWRSATDVFFTTVRPGPVRAEVCDVAGRIVRVLEDRTDMAAGEHSMHWDLKSDSGNRMASGVYFVRVLSPGHIASGTLVVL
jgi:hypothetical protein